MTVSSEVQRTLVKSPPELWAELSDPAALGRHLGELGEIRIVRTVPETTVEWEAAEVAGRVHIKPSAWGTKVTLSVTGELPQKPESEPDEPVSGGNEPVSGGNEPASGGNEPESERQSQSIPVIPASAQLGSGDPSRAGSSVTPPSPQLGSGDPAGSGSEPATPTPTRPEFVSDVPSVRADAADSQSPTPASGSGSAAQPQLAGGSEAPRGSEPQVRPRRRLFARAWRRLLRGRPAEDASAATEKSSDSDEDLLVSRPSASQAAGPAPAASISDSALQNDDPEPPGPVAAAPEPGATKQPAAASVEPAANVSAEQPENVSSQRPANASAEQPENVSSQRPANASAEQPENVSSQRPANASAEQPENPSTELDTAGEGPAEQLTAVLVSVLDRLGAAHHRPFSRA